MVLIQKKNWFKHIYFITSIHSTYTQYITGGLGWKQKLIRTLSKKVIICDQDVLIYNQASFSVLVDQVVTYLSTLQVI